MDSVINMLAHLSANMDDVESAIVAFKMKPKDGDSVPPVEVLTMGSDAISIFGLGELVKLQLFKNMEDNND